MESGVSRALASHHSRGIRFLERICKIPAGYMSIVWFTDIFRQECHLDNCRPTRHPRMFSHIQQGQLLSIQPPGHSPASRTVSIVDHRQMPTAVTIHTLALVRDPSPSPLFQPEPHMPLQQPGFNGQRSGVSDHHRAHAPRPGAILPQQPHTTTNGSPNVPACHEMVAELKRWRAMSARLVSRVLIPPLFGPCMQFSPCFTCLVRCLHVLLHFPDVLLRFMR